MAAVRLLIADDHYVTRSGLVAMVRHSGGLSVAGETDSVAGAVAADIDLAPDIVLVNLRCLDGDELQDLVSTMRCPTVIVLRAEGSAVGLDEAVRADVAGYADLDALQGDLAEMVSIVRRGCSVSIVSERTLSSSRGDSCGSAAAWDLPSSLTARETEVLKLVGAGLTNRVIAATLHVAETTVKKHCSRIMRKLGVSSRTEVAIFFSHLVQDERPCREIEKDVSSLDGRVR